MLISLQATNDLVFINFIFYAKLLLYIIIPLQFFFV